MPPRNLVFSNASRRERPDRSRQGSRPGPPQGRPGGARGRPRRAPTPRRRPRRAWRGLVPRRPWFLWRRWELVFHVMFRAAGPLDRRGFWRPNPPPLRAGGASGSPLHQNVGSRVVGVLFVARSPWRVFPSRDL